MTKTPTLVINCRAALIKVLQTSTMTFELLPVIDIMIDLYGKPKTFERFRQYLKTLQGGTKGDLAIPISGFNPMAKEHVPGKLKELKDLGAEQIIKEIINNLDADLFSKSVNRNFKVAINLSDDLKGGWTNRFTSDYDSKFKFNGLFSRDFCTPIFWTSENFTEDSIKERVAAYIFRTVYWLTNPKPKTLKQHVEQEIYVAGKAMSKNKFEETGFADLDKFYRDNEHTENYHIIFNFFYGDKAAASLEFPTYGIVENVTGFYYAVQQAQKNK